MMWTAFLNRLLIVSLAVSVLAAAPLQPLAGQPPPPTEEKLPAILTPKPRTPAPGDDDLRKLLVARYNAAVAEMQGRHQEFQAGHGSFDGMVETARRLLDSEVELSDKPADEIAAREKFLELAKFLEKLQQARYDAARLSIVDLESARYLRLDAEIQLLKAKRKAGSPK